MRGVTREILIASELRASPEAVWARVASLQGINHELGPWLRMTAPRDAELSSNAIQIGQRWFRSWILLLGLVPIDYDDLCIERIEPEQGFLERSKMFSAPIWEHERTLERLDAGSTRLEDRVAFTPRLSATAGLHRAVIAAIFRHRHRRLRTFFGSW
jgi:ligand-binding SRPBCC domain-containing protein